MIIVQPVREVIDSAPIAAIFSLLFIAISKTQEMLSSPYVSASYHDLQRNNTFVLSDYKNKIRKDDAVLHVHTLAIRPDGSTHNKGGNKRHSKNQGQEMDEGEMELKQQKVTGP